MVRRHSHKTCTLSHRSSSARSTPTSSRTTRTPSGSSVSQFDSSTHWPDHCGERPLSSFRQLDEDQHPDDPRSSRDVTERPLKGVHTHQPHDDARRFHRPGVEEVLPDGVIKDEKASLSVSKQFTSCLLVELAELSEHNFTIFQSCPRNAENAKRPETKVSE